MISFSLFVGMPVFGMGNDKYSDPELIQCRNDSDCSYVAEQYCYNKWPVNKIYLDRLRKSKGVVATDMILPEDCPNDNAPKVYCVKNKCMFRSSFD